MIKTKKMPLPLKTPPNLPFVRGGASVVPLLAKEGLGEVNNFYAKSNNRSKKYRKKI
jgi:hypothetical protein